jgi:hypothetical protein
VARTRASLTDKQEKILIQCQLMGMTTADMVKISNRLRALDAEREFRVKVDEVSQGKSWIKKSRNEYVITDEKGREYKCVMSHKSRDYWNASEKWEVHVNHPGTRMKEKFFKEQTFYASTDEQARICPDGDKRLYRLLKAISNGKFS